MVIACYEWVCVSLQTPCNEVFGPLRIHLVFSSLPIYVITIPRHSTHMAKPVLRTYPNQFHPVHTVQNSSFFFQTKSSNSIRSLSKTNNQRNIQALLPANYNNHASLSLIFSAKHFSILKTEEEEFSQTSIPTYQSIRSHVQKYCKINAHCRENLKFLKFKHASIKIIISLLISSTFISST
jgi:hypothetical protein